MNATPDLARRRRKRRVREAATARDIQQLAWAPQVVAVAAVSGTEQDNSREDQPAAIAAVCANARPVPWDLKHVHRYVGSRSEYQQQDSPVIPGLLADVRGGLYDVIVAKDASRITRILREGIELLDACRDRDRPIWIHFYMHARTYDPSNTADRQTLVDHFKRAEDEVGTTRDRTAGGVDQARTKGRNVGITPYGYVVYYDATLRRPPLPVRTIAFSCTRKGCKLWYSDIPTDGNGRPVTSCPECHSEVAELQAGIIREIIGWAGAGVSTSTIALRLNKRGVPPSTRRGRYGIDEQGRPLRAIKDAEGNATAQRRLASRYGMWLPETVLGIATNPAYIGMVCAEPPTTPDGYYGGYRDRDLGNLVKAEYPPIVREDAFWLAANYLALAGKVVFREGAEHYDPPQDGHKHHWVQLTAEDGNAVEGRFRCDAEVKTGEGTTRVCGKVRTSRPRAATHDLTHIAICSEHRAPITPGNKAEVMPKDVPANALRALMAACGTELEAAAPPPGGRYEHAAADSAEGISAVLRAAVAAGRLAPGIRLPSSRALAVRLGMSRARVNDAYGVLVREGMVTARPQSGYFVAGEAAADGDGKRSYTGQYKRYYRCSAAMDVNVPEHEANEHIATVVAGQLCALSQAGGFTRRITEEHATARSELAKARKDMAAWAAQVGKSDPEEDKAYLEVLKEKMRGGQADITRLKRLAEQSSVPGCLQVFLACEGDFERTRAAYLALETEQRRMVLKELTAEIVMYPAKSRGLGHNDIADRVRVTEWAPWYVVSSDTARAADGGEHITDADTGRQVYPVVSGEEAS